MDMQNVSNLTIPEGEVRAIHNFNNQLLWGRVNYDAKYAGDTFQQTYSGKNLCPNPLEYGIYDFDGAKSGSDTGSVRSTNLLRVSPSTQYRFSCNGTAINVWLYEYDSNGTFISGTRQLIYGVAFTTGSSTHFVTFYKASNTGLTGYQLEKGASITPYEKYVGGTASPNPEFPQDIQVVTGEQTVSISDGINTQSYTISLGSTELCKIGNYQDYIYKSGDDWYVHKATNKATLNGSEYYFKNNYVTGEDVYAFNQSTAFPDSVLANEGVLGFLCGSFITKQRPQWTSDIEGVTQMNDRTFLFTILRSRMSGSTVTDWQTWLSSNNVTLYYALATPTDTKITDSTLISQLNAVHEWLTRYGYNATVSGNLPMIIDRTNL